MYFAVMGPLEVRDDDHKIRLGPPKQRLLLAILIRHANTAVSMDRLVDELWGDSPPKTAQDNLHLYIHQLRRVLGDRRIRRLESGYRLWIGPGELDADQFADLVEGGRSAQASGDVRRAAELFESALALCRGTPYAGFDDSPTVSGEAARLEECRLTVVEEWAGAGLVLGRHGGLVAELSRLAAEHPLRERFSAQLMVALFRSGRQAEALEVYRAAQLRLADELGLDPGPQLTQIHEGVLRGALPDECWPVAEQRPPAAERVPAQLPPDVADFVGRSRQIELTEDLLGRPQPRGLPVVAIAGMAGIGKTTLAVHAAHRLASAFPDGQLYANLRGIESSPVAPAAVLGRFLRALGARPEDVPEDPGERIDLFRSRLAGRRVLILLDDAANEAQVRPLLPGSPTCAVLITSRTRPAGLEGARLIELDALDVEDSMELLGHIAGPERIAGERDAAVEIARLCGFLPLALRIAAVRLATRPQRSLCRFRAALADERRRLDELETGDLSVRASLSLSHRALPAPARHLLRLLGRLGPIDFANWVPAALLKVSMDEAEPLLDTLIEAQLLGISAVESTGRLRYRLHDLVRVFAREQAGEDQHTVELSRVFGCLLALMERMHRKVHGGDHTPLHGTAVRWRPADLDEIPADQLGTWLEAERPTILAAVQQSAELGLHELCWDLATTATALFEAGGFLDDWSATHDVALAATRGAGNTRGEAAVLNSIGALGSLGMRRVPCGDEGPLRGVHGRRGGAVSVGSVGSVGSVADVRAGGQGSGRQPADTAAVRQARPGRAHR